MGCKAAQFRIFKSNVKLCSVRQCVFLYYKTINKCSFCDTLNNQSRSDVSQFLLLRSREDKAYPLVLEDEVVDVYCHMAMATTGNGACGDGGWTLVIKMDGNQVTLPLIPERYD